MSLLSLSSDDLVRGGPALSVGMGTKLQQVAAQKASGKHGQFGELMRRPNAGVDLYGRFDAAEDESTPPNVLAELATDADPNLR